MTDRIILSYLLIVGGILIWSLTLVGRKKVSPTVVEYANIFSGAFLLGICFLHLIPHLFLHGFETENGFKLGACVLIGFLSQILLEYFTQGIEHGHNHCQCCEEEKHQEVSHHHHHHKGACHETSSHPVVGLLVGLSLHAFVEGMPLIDDSGTIHEGLLYGVVLHNIPLTLVLLSLFLSNGYSNVKSVCLISLFAVMTPLGSLCYLFLMPHSELIQAILTGLVVGILLHVSVSILFDRSHNKFNFIKFTIIVIAFLITYLLPECGEIYLH